MKPRRLVLDAGVLALYFAGREDAKRIIDDVYEGRAEAYMSEINVAEFLYNYARVFGWEAALARHSLIRDSPIRIVGVDEALTLEAARLKLRYYNTLSLADCYLVALARQKRAHIVTTDSTIKNNIREVKTIVLEV